MTTTVEEETTVEGEIGIPGIARVGLKKTVKVRPHLRKQPIRKRRRIRKYHGW